MIENFILGYKNSAWEKYQQEDKHQAPCMDTMDNKVAEKLGIVLNKMDKSI